MCSNNSGICVKRDLQYHLLSKNIQGKAVVRQWPDPPGWSVAPHTLPGFAACGLGKGKDPIFSSCWPQSCKEWGGEGRDIQGGSISAILVRTGCTEAGTTVIARICPRHALHWVVFSSLDVVNSDVALYLALTEGEAKAAVSYSCRLPAPAPHHTFLIFSLDQHCCSSCQGERWMEELVWFQTQPFSRLTLTSCHMSEQEKKNECASMAI